MDPTVAFLGPNRAVAAWTHIPPSGQVVELRNATQATLADREFDRAVRLFREGLNTYEIHAVTWDGERWSRSVNITNDSLADGAPALAADPSTGRALLAWVKDLSADPSPGTRRQAIYFAEWDGAVWSAPAELFSSAGQNYAPSVAFGDGRTVVVWVEDQDGDMNTVADARLMMATRAGGQWQSLEPVAGVPGGASSPQVALDSQGNALIAFTVFGPGTHLNAEATPHVAYMRGARVDIAPLGNAPGEAPRVLITPEDEALVFFRPLGPAATFASGSGKRSVTTFLRGLGFPDPEHGAGTIAASGALVGRALGDAAPAWGAPRVVASAIDGEWSSFAVALGDPATVYLAAANAFATPIIDQRGFTTYADRMSYLRLAARPNPVVESLALSDPNAGPAQTVTVEATVTNLGLVPLQPGATVTFYMDAPGDPARVIGQVPLAPLAFSTRQTVSASFRSDGRQHLIFAVATNAEDAARLAGRFDAVVVSRPLPTPFNVRAGASPIGEGVLINWNVEASPDIAQFTISRADSAAGPYRPVGTSTVPAFLDEAAPAGVALYYRVASEDAAGQRSAPSEAAATSAGGP